MLHLRFLHLLHLFFPSPTLFLPPCFLHTASPLQCLSFCFRSVPAQMFQCFSSAFILTSRHLAFLIFLIARNPAGTLLKSCCNLAGPLLEANGNLSEPCWSLARTLLEHCWNEPSCNLVGTLLRPRWNLAGTLQGTWCNLATTSRMDPLVHGILGAGNLELEL